MPNFKEFIKGFEEKPEAKNPNPAPTPKPQEVKMEQPKPKKAKDHRVTQSYYEKQGNDWVRKSQDTSMADEDYVRNVLSDTPQPFEQSHRLYKQGKGNYKHDTYESISPDGMTKSEWRVEYPGEFEIEEPKKPQPKEGSFEKMMQGFEQPKMATEKKAEQYHEPKPKVEMDEDYERSWGPEQKKDGYYKDNKGEIYLVEQGDTYYPVNEAERTEFFNAFNKQAKEAQQPQQPKTNIPDNFFDKPEDAAYDYFGKSFEKAEWGDNAYKTKDGEEWWIGTEEQAHQAAKDDINDFLESEGIIGFTDEFRNWIAQNAIDEKFLSEVQDEEADYYEQDGDVGTANAIRDMDQTEFVEYLKMNIGEREFYDLIQKNKAYDADKIAEEAIAWDDVAHFIGRYDGREYELPNGFVAYRQN